MSDYEPPAEMVEGLARELWDERCREATQGCPWSGLSRESRRNVEAEARFVLRRQHERENGLLLQMEQAIKEIARGDSHVARIRLFEALAAHAKLDAAPEPTLLEAAKAVTDAYARECAVQTHLIALKAAVEREEKR